MPVQEQFDALARGELGAERYELFERLRAEPSIFFNETVNAWVITRFVDARAVLSADEIFRPLTSGPGSAVYGRSFLQLNGAEHNKKVGIVGRRIRSAQAISSGLGDVVRRSAESRAAALPFDAPVDLKADYTALIPLDVLTHLFQIEQTDELRSIYDTIEHGGMASVADPGAREHALAAIPRLKAYLAPIMAERRAAPSDDLISDLVTATYAEEPLPDDELVAMIAFLLIAGVKTTDRVLASTFRRLATDQMLWDELREHRDDDAALLAFAAEALRLDPPAGGITRQAHADFEVAGTTIKDGDRVLVLVTSANRDETEFDRPEDFMVDRFSQNAARQFTSAAQILPFGAGTHFCVGVRLAATELTEALRAILNRVVRLEPAGPLPPPTGFLHYGPSTVPVHLRAAL